MAVAYPGDFPPPLFENFSATVDMGVIRADDATGQAQRRVHRTMPHAFQLSFVMSIAQWAIWSNWVSVHGYGWFDMPLPSLYAGRTGQDASPVSIRFTSDIAAAPVSATAVRVSVSAESSPAMIAQYLAAV